MKHVKHTWFNILNYSEEEILIVHVHVQIQFGMMDKCLVPSNPNFKEQSIISWFS